MSVNYEEAFSHLARIADSMETLSAAITRYLDKESEYLDKETKRFDNALRAFHDAASNFKNLEPNPADTKNGSVKDIDPFDLQNILSIDFTNNKK